MVNLIFWLVLAALSFSPKEGDRRATCQDKLAGGQIYTGFTPSKEVNVTGVNSIYYITGCSKSLGRSCPQSPERERERCDYLKPRFVFLEGPAHPHGVFLESWLFGEGNHMNGSTVWCLHINSRTQSVGQHWRVTRVVADMHRIQLLRKVLPALTGCVSVTTRVAL